VSKNITILGATGSIGINTLEVLRLHPDAFQVCALTAYKNITLLIQQCVEWIPKYAVVVDENAAEQCQKTLKKKGLETEVLSGADNLARVASLPEVDIVMAAIVGAAGLLPTLAAAQAGKRILLANKESLVMSGQLFMDAVRQNNAELLPIDSEHNAIFQSMPASFTPSLMPKSLKEWGIERILLTASGGPFRTTPLEKLATVTPEQACAHPKWKMGRKISVDSATMMNKGLEVIEACWLFSAPPQKVDVILHPQSVIHSMVEYVDGSILAQLSNPDMRTPIAHALAWPQRISSGTRRLNFLETHRLDFELMDFKRFPCLELAYKAIITGGTMPTILNAANEVAVSAFLEKRLPFTAISQIIEKTLTHCTAQKAETVNSIIEEDQYARSVASEMIDKMRVKS
jgi:1-deoxy-D-xylulose-5-phosphate reductoisomerase